MYIVIELQTNADGTVGNFVFAFSNYYDAEAKYHTLLSVAAVSALPVHAVAMFTNSGHMIKSEYYRHGDDAA